VRFFTTHGKQKQLTAPAPNGVGQPLPCAEIKTHGKQGLFAVRLQEKRTANIGSLPCACLKTHGKQGPLPCATIKNARQTFSKKIKKPQSPCSEGHVDMLALITVYTN
jgi:hypothetical protein